MTATPRDDGEDPARIDTDPRPWSQVQDEQQPLPMPGTGRAKVSPAAALRKRCKEALKGLAYLGSRPLWEPRVTAGKVHFAGSKREFLIGSKGQADVIVTFFGHSFHAELKAGNDRERQSQKDYAPFIHRSHGTRVVVRQPRDLIDAMMHWYETHPATIAEAKRDQARAS